MYHEPILVLPGAVIRHLQQKAKQCVFFTLLILFLWAVVTCCSQRAKSCGSRMTSKRNWQVYWVSSAIRYAVAVCRSGLLNSYPALNSLAKCRHNFFSNAAVIYNKLLFTALKYSAIRRHSLILQRTNFPATSYGLRRGYKVLRVHFPSTRFPFIIVI